MARAIMSDRLYSTEHEWLKIDGSQAIMGISDYAQCSLGDVVYVELPSVGQVIKQGAAIGVVESVKAVSDLFAPISGKVVALNQEVIDNPELINHDPYGKGWLIRLELHKTAECDKLLDNKAYSALLEGEAAEF